MDRHITLTIDGARYVAVPEDEYRRFRGEVPSAQEDAVAWARANVGASLRRAREEAKITQAELAKRLRKSQTLVSRAESGEVSVSERYVAAVLKACGLPEDWVGDE